MNIQFHTIDNAPQEVKEDLQNIEKMFGTMPNLFAGLAASPAATKSYMALAGNLKSHAALTPIEQQVAYIAISAENGCDYCVAAHSAGATMAKMPEDVLAALREQKQLPDARLEALRTFALALQEKRGYLSVQDLAAFAEAGYTQQHLLDVITILAQKTMSNYFNHIAHTPLDEMFKPMAWTPAANK